MLKLLDLDRIADGLTTWLARKLPGARALRVSNLLRPSLGLSNDTALFDSERCSFGRAADSRLTRSLTPSALDPRPCATAGASCSRRACSVIGLNRQKSDRDA